MRILLVKVGWTVMLLLAFSISGYAIAFLVFDDLSSPYLKKKFFLTPWTTYSHIIGGAVALAIGSFQLNSTMRNKHLALHRFMGRTYLIAILFGGVGGLYMATVSMGGLPGHFGFGTLAVLWLTTGIMAYIRIRQGQVAGHRKWMIRNFSLTLAAVTLRIYLPIFPWLFNIEFEQAYTIISWACWIPNLIVAEWLFNRQPNREKLLKPKRAGHF
jgi:uncharacterized membrane protein